MLTQVVPILICAAALCECRQVSGGNIPSEKHSVRLVPDESTKRVDVFVDGQPFTAYTWTEKLKVPVLYPLRTASGTLITRGFPLEPRAGERTDHPHHVGWWLNYCDVNGVDFWNNSVSLAPERAAKMGTVVHRKIVRATDGVDRGELDVEMDWVMPDGSDILREATKFVFHAGKNLRAVDRITSLTALDKPVLFKDDKDGLLALRVRRELEQPSNEPQTFTDASGHATSVKVMDNTGVTGLYRSSEGKTGDAVWGTRGRWCMLTGVVTNESITIAILDHPANVGFPTYWHARGYGLFAANPLGAASFSKGEEKLNLTLQPRESVTFRYRLLILNTATTPEDIENEYRKFVNEVE